MVNNRDNSDRIVVKRANAAVKFAIEKKKATNVPIVVYDRKTKAVCYSNSADGKVVTLERITKGRYSERVEQA